MKRVAVYPGTFDPLTNGHVNIVQRALSLFDQIIIAVASNPDKRPFLPYDQRITLARANFVDEPRVTVEGFDTLLTDFLRSRKANVVIRGLRAVSDFEYEFSLAGMNRKLMPEIETIYLMPSDEYMFMSSSFVREVAKLNGDVSRFVPPVILAALQKL